MFAESRLDGVRYGPELSVLLAGYTLTVMAQELHIGMACYIGQSFFSSLR